MSAQARQGLVEALAFLSLDERPPDHRDVALNVVHGLLAACRANWKVWATLGAGIADLAELAPEEFLATVESSLGDKVPEILKLFGGDRGDPDPFPSPVLHTNLLWSLERLAWSPRYLTRVAKILGSLARQDPGGRYRNRPAASLYGIFCPWLPQTAAELRERLGALSALQSAEPESAFDLLLAMMPNRAGGEMLMPAGNPRWNSWKPAERQVPRAEYDNAISDAALRLLDLAGAEPQRWVRIAKDLDRLPIRAREQALAAIRKDVPRLSAETRSDVWNAIRGLVNSHREFARAKWALSPEEVSAIEELLPVLEPGDLVVRHAWLFGHHPNLGEEREWDAEQAEIERRRREAVKSLLETRGVEGVRALAEAVEVPGFVGRALGHLPLTSAVEDEVLREKASSATSDEVFVRGFIGGRLESAGPGWRDAVLARHRESWTASRTASVYLMESAGADTWNRLTERRRKPGGPTGLASGLLEWVMRSPLGGRPDSCSNMISLFEQSRSLASTPTRLATTS
ncbi:MAG: hypothetical protein IPL89_16200 [Acidobacteria bacterium]|nr:hypothetical protein [Acidobacteriota bacterium]